MVFKYEHIGRNVELQGTEIFEITANDGKKYEFHIGWIKETDKFTYEDVFVYRVYEITKDNNNVEVAEELDGEDWYDIPEFEEICNTLYDFVLEGKGGEDGSI